MTENSRLNPLEDEKAIISQDISTSLSKSFGKSEKCG